MKLDKYVVKADLDKADQGILWWAWERINPQYQIVANSKQRFSDLQQCQADYLAHQGTPILPGLEIDEVVFYRYSLGGEQWKEGYGAYGSLNNIGEFGQIGVVYGQIEDREKIYVIENNCGVYSNHIQYDPVIDKPLKIQVKDRSTQWIDVQKNLNYRNQ